MNVLVIIIDTLRWDHLGFNKQKPIHTPNIDRFAQRATVFDNAFIGSFPTIPHRTDCFTGNVNFPRYDWKPLGEEEITLPQVLGEAGYHTGFIADTKHMFVANFPRVFNESRLTWNPPADNPKLEDMPFLLPPEHVRQDGAEYRTHMAAMAHFKKESDWFVAQSMMGAADWLQDNAKRDKWFLWVDTFEVHEWWHTPQYYVDMYDPNYDDKYDYDFPNYGYTDIYEKKHVKRLWAHYAAEVTLTDRWVGHLLDQLDVMRLWDNTMVVLTSDHGMYLGEHRRMGKHTVDGSDPWPLYNEVSHIPLLVWMPMKGLKKRVAALAQPTDLMATILDAAQVKEPRIHGQSWLPLMTGEKRRNWEAVYSSKFNGDGAKISYCPTWLTATTERWTYVAQEPGHRPELYDLRADPGQKRNLARKRPEVCASLQQGIVRFLREQNATEGYVARYGQ